MAVEIEREIAPEAREALEAGDLDALLAFHRERFGGWFMEDDGGDDDDEDDDDEGGDGGDEDEDDDEEYEPPSKAEWKKTQEALKKANAQAKKHRLAARKAAASKDSGDSDEKVKKAIAEEGARWRPRLINKAAKAALAEAGGKKVDRLVKLIDHDDLEIDDDGEVEGLDDAIEELKEDYPELFKSEDDDDETKQTRRRRRPGSHDAGSGKGRTSSKQKSSAERIAAGLGGGR